MVHNLVHNLCESLVTNIGNIADTGKRTPPTPIIYLTQWKIVGNSEVHGNEIWSCGDYSAVDGKYHVKISNGVNVFDIALTEPLRKAGNVADTIEFPSDTEGKALVTRKLLFDTIDDKTWTIANSRKVCVCGAWNSVRQPITDAFIVANILLEGYTTYSYNELYMQTHEGCAQTAGATGLVCVYIAGGIPEEGNTPTQTFYNAIAGKHILIELATPTTELVDAPQIEEADSYSMVISQGGKAVEWSSFETN